MPRIARHRHKSLDQSVAQVEYKTIPSNPGKLYLDGTSQTDLTATGEKAELLPSENGNHRGLFGFFEESITVQESCGHIQVTVGLGKWTTKPKCTKSVMPVSADAFCPADSQFPINLMNQCPINV